METTFIVSILKFFQLLFLNKLKLSNKLINRHVVIEGREYLIFRHAYIKEGNDSSSPAILAIRFQFKRNSLKADRIASYFQIPFFVGIPGFQAKLWTYDEKNDFFQGTYQWKSVEDVNAYLNSYAISFVKKKVKENSLSYNIYENTDLNQFIKGKIK